MVRVRVYLNGPWTKSTLSSQPGRSRSTLSHSHGGGARAAVADGDRAMLGGSGQARRGEALGACARRGQRWGRRTGSALSGG
jgi:hypothetical protein